MNRVLEVPKCDIILTCLSNNEIRLLFGKLADLFWLKEEEHIMKNVSEGLISPES